MKRFLAIILATALLAVSGLAEADAATRAKEFLDLLNQGKYDEALLRSSDEMGTAMGGADGYAQLWRQLLGYGAYAGVQESSVAQSDEYTLVTLLGLFENAALTFQIALDGEGLLSGLYITDVQPRTASQDKGRTEVHTLRAGEADATEAELLLPDGEGPFPAVVLIPGSGPCDRNASAYGLTPFLDLAKGLALEGVASLRYDKYTYAHSDLLTGDALSRFTVEREYLPDVAAAVALLDEDPRISAIYLVGHSQGAMLVPRLLTALESDKLSGAAMLCGTPKHLWEIQYAQNLAVLETLSGKEAEPARALIETEREKARGLSLLSPSALLEETLFGLPAYYQLDEMSVDAAETARTLALPLFIAQGGKDWQVTPEDGITAWQAALGEAENVTYRLYPNMNHLLADQPGQLMGDPADYSGLSGVTPALTDDLAAWVLAQKAR